MREVQSGLWWWEAVQPEWRPEDAATADWGPEVSSYAIDDGGRLLLIDPTTPPSPVDDLAADRETVIVLTCPWHRRDALSLAERFGASIYVPPPDEGDPNPVEGQVFRAGDRLPIGVEAFPGMEPNDLVLWIESRRALAAGDTLVDRGQGFEFPTDWANKGVPAAQILETLRPLLIQGKTCRRSAPTRTGRGRPRGPSGAGAARPSRVPGAATPCRQRPPRISSRKPSVTG